MFRSGYNKESRFGVAADKRIADEARAGEVVGGAGYIDEEPAPNSTIFWVLFAVSLPLTIPLALLVLLLFLGVWGDSRR